MTPTLLQTILDEATVLLAPDRRTVVFEVHINECTTGLVLDGEVQDVGLKTGLLEFMRVKTGMSISETIRVLPDPSLGDTTKGIVNLSVASIHRTPTNSAEIATQALLGTPVDIIKKQDSWCLVRQPDNYLGWIDSTLVQMSTDQFMHWSSRPKIIVTADSAHTSTMPRLDAPRVSDVVAGNILALDGVTDDWYSVSYPDGRTGYLPGNVAFPLRRWLASAHDTPESIVSTALRFMGVPYLWGGASTKALDCSGFVKIVFFLNGVLLPRDADQQAKVGIIVDTSASEWNVKPGDLLFFSSQRSDASSPRITHVGISLGAKRFIQESGDVHINSLDPSSKDYNEKWAQSFVMARRIIGVGAPAGIVRLRDVRYYSQA